MVGCVELVDDPVELVGVVVVPPDVVVLPLLGLEVVKKKYAPAPATTTRTTTMIATTLVAIADVSFRFRGTDSI